MSSTKQRKRREYVVGLLRVLDGLSYEEARDYLTDVDVVLQRSNKVRKVEVRLLDGLLDRLMNPAKEG